MSSEQGRWSERPGTVGAWAALAAFGTYFCMYAFRKPFTAAGFASEPEIFGVGFKSLLVSTQVLGYALSKVIGIRFISELPSGRRALWLLALIGGAEAALVGFAVTPAPWRFAWLFANGLCLGMVFGLVLGFLEGRRLTEALSAGLCTSFIVADGATKSVGADLLARGISEAWMPAAAGALFFPPLLVFLAMLTRVPPPTPSDIALRAERAPMSASDRRDFFLRYQPGLTLLMLMYLLVTLLRSVRADFAPEIWKGLGVSAPPELFTRSELLVALGILLLNGSVAWIRDNRTAFFTGLGLSAVGAITVAVAALGHQLNLLPPLGFMVLVGLGLYLPYIAVHTTLFERLLAMTRERGNIGFLMYVADSSGYVGYVGLMLSRGRLTASADLTEFFITLCWGVAIGSLALLIPAWRSFATHPDLQVNPAPETPAAASA